MSDSSQTPESLPAISEPTPAASPAAASAGPDKMTPLSVVKMALMTPVAGLAAVLCSALMLILGGGLIELLIWINAGITGITGKVFVFQIILVLAIIVLLPLTLLVGWAAAGVVVS